MKRNWQLLGYFTLVFVAGLGVGIMGQRLYSTSTVIANAPRPKPDDFRKVYMAEMKSRLNLDDGQLQKLGAILDDTRQRYRDVRERNRPEMESIQNHQISQVNAILSADQKTEYAKMRAEREARRKQMEKDRDR